MMRRIIVWILLTVLLAACGRAAPHRSAPAPDSDHSAFRSADVTIDTGAVTLAGTLLTPLEGTPAPAVIIIPGSGAATRNGSWNMYRSIGEYLAERGIAVLLYDKRGVGGSTGDWESETFDERAQDVAAMIAFLQTRAEIDPDRIGLIGHSQGAYIAPLVVAKHSKDVKFVVLLAGSGQKVWDQILTNERAESLGNGLSEEEVNERVSGLEGQLRFLQKVQSPCRFFKAHYLCFVLDYDPAPALQALTVPTLALYAELDTQVPPDVNIPLIETALKSAGNQDYIIHTFEKANHWFAPAELGTTAEIRELMQNRNGYDFVPGFLEMIGDWIESHWNSSRAL
ncbi:MAG: alpha/beta hydrolase family protein [Chloroflexota bacterium]|nr:alpha/beta fold hydrolase [Chloroflexota bacterium]